MRLRDTWADWCISLACSRSDVFWSGSRLILSNIQWEVDRLDKSLRVEHVGYTDYKITRLNTQYFVPEAVEVAMMLHKLNLEKRRYASSSFHCYGHLLKVDPDKKSKHGSMMGPCVQSVVMTCKPPLRRTEIDVFYRTTEVFKKFPGDLIWLRDHVAPLIPQSVDCPVRLWRFHFVNVTCHPMYFLALIPNLQDPVASLLLLKDRNPTFYDNAGKWLCRYLIGGEVQRGIQKFAQAMRTAESSGGTIKADPAMFQPVVRHLYDNRKRFFSDRSRLTSAEVDAGFRETMEGFN